MPNIFQLADVNRLRAVDPRLAYSFAPDGPFLHFTGQNREADENTLAARAADAIIAQYTSNPTPFIHIFSALDPYFRELSAAESGAPEAFPWAVSSQAQAEAAELLHREAEAIGATPLGLLYGFPEVLVSVVPSPTTSDILGMLAVGNIEDHVVRETASVTGGRLTFLMQKESWDTNAARAALCANFLIHPQSYYLVKAGCSASDIRDIADTENSELLNRCIYSGAAPQYAVAAIRAGITDIDAIARGSVEGTPIEYLAAMTE